MSEPRTCCPEAFVFAIAFGDAENLRVVECIKLNRQHHRLPHHLQVAARAAVDPCGIDVIVRDGPVVELPAQELTFSSRPWRTRFSNKLEMPLAPHSAFARASAWLCSPSRLFSCQGCEVVSVGVSPTSPLASQSHSHHVDCLSSLSRERLIRLHLDEHRSLNDLDLDAGISIQSAKN
jgi:hypothetical protein